MISVIILTGKVSHCFCLLLSFENKTIITIWGEPDFYNQIENKALCQRGENGTSCQHVLTTPFSSARLTWPIACRCNRM